MLIDVLVSPETITDHRDHLASKSVRSRWEALGARVYAWTDPRHPKTTDEGLHVPVIHRSKISKKHTHMFTIQYILRLYARDMKKQFIGNMQTAS